MLLGCTHSSAACLSLEPGYRTSLHAPIQLNSLFCLAQAQMQEWGVSAYSPQPFAPLFPPGQGHQKPEGTELDVEGRKEMARVLPEVLCSAKGSR